MKKSSTLASILAVLVFMSVGLFLGPFAPSVRAAEDVSITVIMIAGTVEVAPAGTDNWAPAKLNQKLQPGDKLRTGKLSRTTLRSAQSGDMPVRESSLMTINAPRAGSTRPVYELVRGFYYFFSRGEPTELDFRNRLAAAAARGTEYTVAVDDNDRIEITVFDGIVDLNNAQGSVTMASGEQGVAVPGQKPTKTAAINATNLVQWVLYYPGVIHLDELALGDAEKQVLSESLTAYRSGDLVRALGGYPANRAPATDAEKIYRAALMLVAGEAGQAEGMLDSVAAPNELSAAVRELIAAVRNAPFTGPAPTTASGWLAESYYRQSRLDLEGALRAARQATQAGPGFGFAWARVAELEFSFGRTEAALTALDKALALTPRNASALALKGFLLSAQNKIPAALQQFDEAIVADGALANAWLGRGLCRIRSGDAAGGREDLRTAAALEPTRAVLRSYLGKAFSDARQTERAGHEFDLARRIDPNDPTSWLYAALHDQQRNRINEAIRALEHSQDLNTNRAVYRSQMLLDQDQSVRSANLAGIYHDAGMDDVSVREAGRAVSSDYANYSAHLFLANSYDRLRDPKQINLRYETPAFAEYLLANLLAPVGAGTLSSAISQQEYSKLFERDRFGVSSTTEYQSSGSWYENGAQYGTFGNSTYAVEGLYRSDRGQRPNNDLEQRAVSVSFKQQLTPKDTVYFQATDYRATAGDVAQYYDQRQANRLVRTIETQEPVVLAGYHHEWNPGNHTVFLAARLDDTYTVRNPQQGILQAGADGSGRVNGVGGASIHEYYESRLNIYSGELQQIFTTPNHSTVLGARVQAGTIETDVAQSGFSDPFGVGLTYAGRQQVDSDFQRTSFYGYHSWRVFAPLQLIGGLTYDYVRYPENYRFAPINDGEETVSRLSPKAGLIWTPGLDTVVRFAYAQSVAGASIDQSYQIEPSQVAGFNQSYRSIIPESIAAANAGARFETFALSLEHKFPTRTYVALSGELLNSQVHRSVGTLQFDQNAPPPPPLAAVSQREQLDYSERSLIFTLNQLIADQWAVGLKYRISRAELQDDYPGYPVGVATIPPFDPHSQSESVLQQMMLYAIYNHRCGWFAQVQGIWSAQDNIAPSAAGDNFWQANVLTGYRLWQRRAEITVGVLNIGDQDYRLNPLNLYSELPRERTFVARFSFKF